MRVLEKQNSLSRAGPVMCFFSLVLSNIIFVEYRCNTRNQYMHRCSTVKEKLDKRLLYRVVPSSVRDYPRASLTFKTRLRRVHARNAYNHADLWKSSRMELETELSYVFTVLSTGHQFHIHLSCPLLSGTCRLLLRSLPGKKMQLLSDCNYEFSEDE